MTKLTLKRTRSTTISRSLQQKQKKKEKKKKKKEKKKKKKRRRKGSVLVFFASQDCLETVEAIKKKEKHNNETSQPINKHKSLVYFVSLHNPAKKMIAFSRCTRKE